MGIMNNLHAGGWGQIVSLDQFDTQGLLPIILTSTISSLLKTGGVFPVQCHRSLCVALCFELYLSRVSNLSSWGDHLSLPSYHFQGCVGNYFQSWGNCISHLTCSPVQEYILWCLMFDVKKCSFIYLVYFGVDLDRSINVSFTPLCRLKWMSPCNQNSLNTLWMIGTDFCAWVQTWVRLCVGEPQSCWRNSPITHSIFYGVCSFQFNLSVVSDSLQPYGLQHNRSPCPSPTPGACSNSCASHWWCHPTVSSSVILFSSCLQSFPVIGSFLMSTFFTTVDQNIGAST